MTALNLVRLAMAMDGETRPEDNVSSRSLEKHDLERHGGHFDPETMTCKLRDSISKMSSEDLLYATSDIHHADLDDVDPSGHGTIVIAGDLMGAGYFKDEEGKDWIEKTFFPWCERHSDKKIVIIPGNHDLYIQKHADEIEWPSNVVFLADKEESVNGMRVYGTPWCRRHKDGAYEVGSRELKEKFSSIPYGLDVLITHTPPYIPGEDIDLDSDMKSHFGSSELTEAIKEKKPKLVICGHVHTGSHKPIKFGDTTIVNVSLVGSDRGKASYGARSIGISRDDSGTGFVLDTDDDTHIEAPADDIPSKSENGSDDEIDDFFEAISSERERNAYLLPDEVMDFYFAIRDVSKDINSGIDFRSYGVDKKLLSRMKDAWPAFDEYRKKSDNPFVHALSLTAWEIAESSKKGFMSRINRTPELPTSMAAPLPAYMTRKRPSAGLSYSEAPISGITDYFDMVSGSKRPHAESSDRRSGDAGGRIRLGDVPLSTEKRVAETSLATLGDAPVSRIRHRKTRGGGAIPSGLKDFKSWLKGK